MGNEEMRKWKESTLHFTQQTADILLLRSSNVMKKFMSIQHLLRGSSIPYSLRQRAIIVYNGIEYCIMVGKLILQFWQLVRLL